MQKGREDRNIRKIKKATEKRTEESNRHDERWEEERHMRRRKRDTEI